MKMRTFNIIAAIVVVLLIVGLYKAKTDAARTRAHVNALEQQIDDAHAEARALRAEIAEQEDPANIEELAREHLGERELREPLPESELDDRLPPPRAEQDRAAP